MYATFWSPLVCILYATSWSPLVCILYATSWSPLVCILCTYSVAPIRQVGRGRGRHAWGRVPASRLVVGFSLREDVAGQNA